MAERVTIEICSPVFRPVTLEAESAIVPGEAGVFTVLPGHTPVLSTLTSGVLVVRESAATKHFYAVHGGFVEVNGDRVRVLADEVEAGEKIDRAAAQADLDRATEGLKKPGSGADLIASERAAVRARARIQAADKAEF